jgi:Tfp pilus assembly protein PilX
MLLGYGRRRGKFVERNRGVALILALLVLSFLSVLGGALLTTSTIDIWISDNYKNSVQSLYLAEAGIDHARSLLHTSGQTRTQLLTTAAGPDHLLQTSDDRPFITSRQLADASGLPAGSYEVWLWNDNADGAASTVDSNEVLTVTSIGQRGTTRKTIEATVQRSGFPETDADPRLKTVDGLERLASSVTNNATDVYGGGTVGDFGGPANYRVMVVEGNVDLGSGAGYGILLVRGELNVIGNVTWNGLIAIIGQGVVRWQPGVSGTINGGLFVARTRGIDGSLLAMPTGVMFDITDPAQIRAANQQFPFNLIAMKEK